ncbi:MAG: acylneuraminate cytidylyltransferase family protein [bacterium]|nr:MAG: acylneuraminate cytidylyltransferase family protein [bacterium]
MNLLAIIPAREGSRGIPNKNSALAAGKPLIVWTIECALASAVVDMALVSTDSRALADLARASGAHVPFLRPAELARDDTPGIAPVLHAIEWMRDNRGVTPRYVVVLQPTSPLRIPADVEAAMTLALKVNADSVVSVTPAPSHPCWMKILDADGRMTDFLPRMEIPFRRQDLPEVYALNGAIYLGRTEMVLRTGGWYSERTYGYVMPPERSLDVDTAWDLHLADLVLRERHEERKDTDR